VLNKIYGWEPFVALLVVMPLMFVLGYLLQLLLINRVVERPPLIALLLTFGLGIIIANIVKVIFTVDLRVTETALSGAWHLSDNVTVPVTKFFVMLAALLMMAGLYVFLQFTRPGKSIRAAAQNKEAARMVGIEINQIYALTFAISIALTGVAGGLISSTRAVYPFMGGAFTLRAFAITAMSGLGNIPGALLGGIIFAMVEVILATYVPGVGTNVGVLSSFVLLVVILATRPQGLFGGLKPATEVH
jgi:branched-chain amino acid transport system permease protein